MPTLKRLKPTKSKTSPQISKRKGNTNVGYVSAGLMQSAVFTAAPESGMAIHPKLRDSAPAQIESNFSPGLSETVRNSSIFGRASMATLSRASSPGSRTKTIQMDEHKQLKETDRPAEIMNSSDPDTSLLDYEDNREHADILRRTLTYSMGGGSVDQNDDITDISDEEEEAVAPHNSIHLTDPRGSPNLKVLVDENEDLAKKEQEARLRLSQSIDVLKTLTTQEKRRAVTPEQQVQYYKKLEGSTELTLREQEAIIKALEDRCANLEQQNIELITQIKMLQEEYDNARKMGGSSDNLHSNELKKENKFLQDQVYKLSVKLSLCQTQHSELHDVNGHCVTGLPADAPIPAWLINHKYLSPLLKGYEDEIAEKDKQIQQLFKKFAKYDADIRHLVQENERLIHGMKGQGYDSDAIHKTAWKQLQQQARLVLEENEVLVKELDLQDEKIRQVQQNSRSELILVEKRAKVLEAERNALTQECAELKSDLHLIRSQWEELRASSSQRIDRLEHTKTILEYKGKIAALEANIDADKDKLREGLNDLQAERDTALFKLRQSEEETKQMGLTLKSSIKTIEELKEKNKELHLHSQETIQYLNSVLNAAEHSMFEVESLAGLALSERKEKKRTVNVIVESELSREKLIEAFRHYKKKAENRIDHLAGKLDKVNGAFDCERREYERQIKHLRLLLREKECEATDAISEKREVEECLEIMWKSAKADSRDMQNSLKKSALRSRSKNMKQFMNTYKESGDYDIELSVSPDFSD